MQNPPLLAFYSTNRKYKVVPGNRLYEQLIALEKRMRRCNAMAKRIARKLGGSKIYVTGNKLAGDIGGITFASTEKPKGFKAVGQKWQHIYMPLSTNKEAWKILKGLLIIENSELNKLLNYKDGIDIEGDSFVSYKRPGINWRKNIILIDVSENRKYKPVAGMTEITVSEYKKLEAGK